MGMVYIQDLYLNDRSIQDYYGDELFLSILPQRISILLGINALPHINPIDVGDGPIIGYNLSDYYLPPSDNLQMNDNNNNNVNEQHMPFHTEHVHIRPMTPFTEDYSALQVFIIIDIPIQQNRHVLQDIKILTILERFKYFERRFQMLNTQQGSYQYHDNTFTLNLTRRTDIQLKTIERTTFLKANISWAKVLCKKNTNPSLNNDSIEVITCPRLTETSSLAWFNNTNGCPNLGQSFLSLSPVCYDIHGIPYNSQPNYHQPNTPSRIWCDERYPGYPIIDHTNCATSESTDNNQPQYREFVIDSNPIITQPTTLIAGQAYNLQFQLINAQHTDTISIYLTNVIRIGVIGGSENAEFIKRRVLLTTIPGTKTTDNNYYPRDVQHTS
eukprot:UN01804